MKRILFILGLLVTSQAQADVGFAVDEKHKVCKAYWHSPELDVMNLKKMMTEVETCPVGYVVSLKYRHKANSITNVINDVIGEHCDHTKQIVTTSYGEMPFLSCIKR